MSVRARLVGGSLGHRCSLVSGRVQNLRFRPMGDRVVEVVGVGAVGPKRRSEPGQILVPGMGGEPQSCPGSL